MLGLKDADEDQEEPDVAAGSILSLNSDNFQQGISNGVSFVKFFAPWCGHCKRLAPTWTELSKKLLGVPNVRLVKVDCTLENSKELCNEQEVGYTFFFLIINRLQILLYNFSFQVEGFPTLFLYKNGEKLSEYNGSRNLEDLYDFLSKHFPHDEL